MALPPSQQHALNAIDDALQSAEPRLATMFGVFTDLTRMEAMPAAETLPPGPWWAGRRLRFADGGSGLRAARRSAPGGDSPLRGGSGVRRPVRLLLTAAWGRDRPVPSPDAAAAAVAVRPSAATG